MLVRPRYCCDKNCPIYKEAKKKEYETSTSKAQSFLDKNFVNNPECKACKEKQDAYFSI